MKFITSRYLTLTLALILSCAIITQAALTPESLKNAVTTSNRQLSPPLQTVRDRIKAAGGCNANICFAVDGSGSISTQEFINQLDFILSVSSIVTVDNAAELAAAQYSSAVTRISPLTANIARFNEIVENTKDRQVRGQSFVVGGINYCFSQLARRVGEPSFIVLLGDGRSNIGSNAVARANLFRRVGGFVAAVGAGFADTRQLLAIAGGNKELLYEVDDFFDVLKLQLIVEDVTAKICGIEEF